MARSCVTEAAAEELETLIVRRCPVKLTPTARCGLALLREFGLNAVAVPAEGFVGYLEETTVFYGSLCSPQEQFLGMMHELAEYLARQDMPSLFDGILDATYDGSESLPGDPRHEIAKRVEALLVKRLRIELIQRTLPSRPGEYCSWRYQSHRTEIEYIPNFDEMPEQCSPWEF